MRVILLKDIPGLGKEGELISVSDGYARNYLIPKKLAILATSKQVKKWQEGVKKEEKLKKEELEKALLLKEKIEALELTKTLKAEKERAFGSVRKEDIIDLLRSHNIQVSKEAIKLNQPIKEAGKYTIPILLHTEISANLSIIVTLSQQP